ncbi:MAG: DUF2441 domain-containing protein [Alphaproteobacteria bacterium]|nr:DUF2441 domain-containing protein [Alphaproteobacteria bacterium]
MNQETFWHTADGSMFTETMLHNARIRKGYFPSGSMTADIVPDGTIQSPYTAFNDNKKKEEVWESIRKTEFSNIPSRIEAIFLFSDQSSLQNALKNWWPNQIRAVFQARFIEGKKFCADASLLNSTEQHWEENAKKYWNGESSDNPIYEIIVNGIIYFPEWETFQFLGLNFKGEENV